MTEIETINKFFHKLCQIKGAHIFSKVEFGDVVNVYETMMREASGKTCNNCGTACKEHGTSRTIYCEEWQQESEKTHSGYPDGMPIPQFWPPITTASLSKQVTELQEKVKALEDQHREPDPEKYECIDLGLGGKIYIPKNFMVAGMYRK